MKSNSESISTGVAVLLLGMSPALDAANHAFHRALSTDRPDATASPYTVEQGRWQIEFEAIRWSRDSDGGIRARTQTYGATNFKYGLTDSSDLQIVVEPMVRRELRVGSIRQTTRGFGDLVVRWKHNLSGNDDADEAWGLMPFVKLPTAADGLGNGEVEGGMIIPYARSLAAGWGLGLMGEIDVVRNRSGSGYESAFIATATVAGEIAPNTGLFLELANETRELDPADWAVTFNTGLTFASTENLQFDGGINLGLTGEAEDIAWFCGVSARW